MISHQEILLQLLDEQGSKLHALLLRMTLREEIAEEFMQDLFIKLNNSKGFFEADDPVAYAFRTAINLVLDYRKKKKHKMTTLDKITEPSTQYKSPLTSLVQTEELDQILNATSKLSEFARTAFTMRYIQQESYEEIARRLKKTEPQIRAVCSKALSQLRKLLAGNTKYFQRKEASHVEE